jgi:hypothetical protein
MRRRVAVLALTALSLQSISCGTLLHPERRGLRSDRLDPAIVALDGIGLLFFFVPGAVAFAVDFATGAIYLPPDQFSDLTPSQLSTPDLKRIEVQPATLDRRQLETIVQQQTGKVIDLNSPNVRVMRLNTLDEFPRVFRNANTQPSSNSAPGW